MRYYGIKINKRVRTNTKNILIQKDFIWRSKRFSVKYWWMKYAFDKNAKRRNVQRSNNHGSNVRILDTLR